MAISLGPPLSLTLPYMPSTTMVDHNKHTTTAAATKRADPSCPWPGGPIQLTSRFALLKENLISGNEAAITASFHRLLSALPEEIDRLSNLGSAAIPSISFTEAQSNPQLSQQFLTTLRERGVGVLRGVVPRETALQWAREAREYAAHLGPSFSSSSGRSRSSSGQNNNNNNNIFWSPAQVKARAHPDVLAAQKFVMTGVWRSADPRARVTAEFPITYADRMGTRTDNLTAGAPTAGTEASRCAQVDGGSVERWEKDGYGGRQGVYRDIWAGRWEEFDPWESSARLGVTSDLYHKASACSIFRMFQGWLALGDMPSGQPGSVRVCPLPRHATAYFLLRPFFSPPSSEIDNDSGPDEKWTLDRPQNSILHGALPSYAQTISPSFHPHLDLPRSLIPVPDLHPGDYLVWHPDLIHSVVSSLDDLSPSTVTTTTTSSPSCSSSYTHIYLPACPLTQTNALYLARQRKSFLSGTPGPDFGGHRFSSISSSTSSTPSSRRGSAFSTTTSSSLYTPPTHLFSSSSSSSHLSAYFGGPSPGLSGGGGGAGGGGETSHAHRAGPTEVGDAGGDDGLRAMGLVPWDEEEADEDATREVLAMANGILFPDLYDYDLL
ncbi:hypothetical protein VTJ04DRAFT_1543 [Mycothermus thermophilus]|uniref:uncharacterized protein n=1 Tax=Humicola insolens TaxID=85995 RepID=UPI0037440ADB